MKIKKRLVGVIKGFIIMFVLTIMMMQSTVKIQAISNDLTVSFISATHNQIKFTVSGASEAQNFIAVVFDENLEVIQYYEVISITSSKQSVTLNIDEESTLNSETYALAIVDGDSNIRGSSYFTVSECKELASSVIAYKDKAVLYYANPKVKEFSVKIFDEIYTSTVSDGMATVTYPELSEGSYVTVIFDDGYGCTAEYVLCVRSEIIEDDYVSVDWEDVLANCTIVHDIGCFGDLERKMCAEINGKVYKTQYTNDYTIKVTYPKQAVGTKITLWYEYKNGAMSSKSVHTVFNPRRNINVYSISSRKITGKIESVYDDYPEGIEKVYVVSSGKKYYGTVKEDKFNIDFSAKVRDKITLVIEDKAGYVFEKECIVPNTPPKLKVKSIYSGARKITGMTKGKAQIIVKIGKKTYKAKSKANGKFTVKIKPVKAKTKVKITVKTKDGNTKTKKVKVKRADGFIYTTKDIYTTTNKITVKITNANVGDKIKLKVGKKTYTKKVTSKKKNQKVTFSISKASAGTKIKAYYYDNFGSKKDYSEYMVYCGDTIYVGMSSHNAELTTWGYPVRKNNYGTGYEQWVYEKGNTTLYVYVSGGKVINLQKFNY